MSMRGEAVDEKFLARVRLPRLDVDRGEEVCLPRPFWGDFAFVAIGVQKKIVYRELVMLSMRRALNRLRFGPRFARLLTNSPAK